MAMISSGSDILRITCNKYTEASKRFAMLAAAAMAREE
jgi:hypothetical protein